MTMRRAGRSVTHHTGRTAIRGNPGRAAIVVVGLLIAGLTSMHSPAAAETRSLTLEERIAAQRAIEQVYWDHRIWPKENPGPKPPLSAVLPDAAIRARVEDTLGKSNALEKYWHRPVTDSQLQAELNRMAEDTQDARLLQELFTALRNDPRLIAETLARRTLVDRLARNWFATDDRFHGKLKRKVEAALASCRSVECMPSMGGEYRETTLEVETPSTERAGSELHRDVVRLDREEWKRQLQRLAQKLGGRDDSLPVLKLSRLGETTEAFVVTAVLSQGKDEMRTATVTWPKQSFDAWWGAERAKTTDLVEDSSNSFVLPHTPSPGCVPDRWDTVPRIPPARRAGHTAVWTGSEMIVWGGALDDGDSGFPPP